MKYENGEDTNIDRDKYTQHNSKYPLHLVCKIQFRRYLSKK